MLLDPCTPEEQPSRIAPPTPLGSLKARAGAATPSSPSSQGLRSVLGTSDRRTVLRASLLPLLHRPRSTICGRCRYPPLLSDQVELHSPRTSSDQWGSWGLPGGASRRRRAQRSSQADRAGPEQAAPSGRSCSDRRVRPTSWAGVRSTIPTSAESDRRSAHPSPCPIERNPGVGICEGASSCMSPPPGGRRYPAIASADRRLGFNLYSQPEGVLHNYLHHHAKRAMRQKSHSRARPTLNLTAAPRAQLCTSVLT